MDVTQSATRRNLVLLAAGLLTCVAVSVVVVMVAARHSGSTRTAVCYASFDDYKGGASAPSVTVRKTSRALDACQDLWARGVLRDGTIDDPTELRYRTLQACTGPNARIVVFPRRNETCQLLGLSLPPR